MELNPKHFGQRVKECRLARGMSQTDLGDEAGQSQTNIDWIEKGGPKRPDRQAHILAKALRTTPEWLLYGEGPRDIGPTVFSPQQYAEHYANLSPAEQQEFSELMVKHLSDKLKRRKSA